MTLLKSPGREFHPCPLPRFGQRIDGGIGPLATPSVPGQGEYRIGVSQHAASVGFVELQVGKHPTGRNVATKVVRSSMGNGGERTGQPALALIVRSTPR